MLSSKLIALVDVVLDWSFFFFPFSFVVSSQLVPDMYTEFGVL